MAGTVPPSSFESFCAIVFPSIVVIIDCAEFCAFFRQALSKLTLDTCIDDSILEVFRSNDEIVDDDLGAVVIEVR